jgi:hypothetical protein
MILGTSLASVGITRPDAGPVVEDEEAVTDNVLRLTGGELSVNAATDEDGSVRW